MPEQEPHEQPMTGGSPREHQPASFSADLLHDGYGPEASYAVAAEACLPSARWEAEPCLRVSGAFFAACDHRSGDLIVKLPRHRVQQLVAAGTGKPFAPAGRTFREWVVIADLEPARWVKLIDEARAFAQRRQRAGRSA